MRSENLELVKTGKLDLDTARNLSIFASHAEIGELSMGLGQYFGAIVHFAWLMLALFICVGCYHLHEFRTNNNLSNKYLVVVKWTLWDERDPWTVYSWCEKSDDDYKKETISIISNSAGTRCNNNMTSSFYNCPTVCTFYTWHGQEYADSRAWENSGDSLCDQAFAVRHVRLDRGGEVSVLCGDARVRHEPLVHRLDRRRLQRRRHIQRLR
jgi:hypothetical protein